MHEAGHAAHFANIRQPSPLFSQERAPTSVAYAENQSMFLDSLCGDAAWRARYALSREGEPLPWPVHELRLRSAFPYRVFSLRAMLSVSYFEKALYELADEEVTPDAVQKLADRVEREVQGGLASRPLLSVPHIISDEASCYYHGYVLAEMSVYQTRRHFLETLGVPIVDNPLVGKTLTESYWAPGNSTPFLDLVERLTGAPLTGAPWLEDLQRDLEAVVASEKKEYDRAVAAVRAASQAQAGDSAVVDLKMRMIIKDGDALIADSEASGGFLPACGVFADYVRKRFGQGKQE
jgi:oligoendopeptidase F